VRTHVDLPMLDALQAEWLQHPPTHHLVAAYLDYKPKAEPDPQQQQEEMLRMLSMMPVVTSAPKLDTSEWDSFAQKKEADHG